MLRSLEVWKCCNSVSFCYNWCDELANFCYNSVNQPTASWKPVGTFMQTVKLFFVFLNMAGLKCGRSITIDIALWKFEPAKYYLHSPRCSWTSWFYQEHSWWWWCLVAEGERGWCWWSCAWYGFKIESSCRELMKMLMRIPVSKRKISKVSIL